MTDTELKELKVRVVGEIGEILPQFSSALDEIDERITEYIRDALECAGVYEILGIRKVLRLFTTYHHNIEAVKRKVRAIEGVWDGGKWVRGGLKFDTPRGAQHVRLMPYQVWCLFGIYCMETDVEMREAVEGEALLPSERIVDGMVYDRRRLCTEADIFQTRKSGKTEFGAAIDFVEMMVDGPSNGQVLIAANSKEQATIAHRAVKAFALQVDPSAMSKAGGKILRVTADEVNYQPGYPKTSSVKVMSAGGKTKDGLYASLVHADEHGSAGYVKDHSDMQDLVEVCAGSMGPRRERLVMHTTTAGLVNEGPYQIELRSVEQSLVQEVQEVSMFEGVKTPEDYRFSFLLRLDPWDWDGENLDMLDDPKLWRKVNRSIGVTVQPTWYKERLHAAKTKGPDTRKEVLTKDFNVWQTDRAAKWITADQIHPLQMRGVRVDDLKDDDDWRCFVGCDFSMGDDLNAVVYLCKNLSSGEFFADMDVWVSEAGYEKSPNKHIYDMAKKQGFLHVCEGSTIDDTEVTNRIIEVADSVTVMRIGYDPYSSQRFMNTLSAWIFANGDDPKNYLMPVSQSVGASNGPVQDLTWMVLSPEPLIHFSESALWGWCFGNCILECDKFENRRPFKRSPSAKIDPVVCLIMGVKMYNDANGAVQS